MEKVLYKVGDAVTFECNGKTKSGNVFIVDAHGTFERPDVISYDILSEKENMIYKHIPQTWIIKDGEE